MPTAGQRSRRIAGDTKKPEVPDTTEISTDPTDPKVIEQNNMGHGLAPGADANQLDGVNAFSPEFLAKYGLDLETVTEAREAASSTKKRGGKASIIDKQESAQAVLRTLRRMASDYQAEVDAIEELSEGENWPVLEADERPVFFGFNNELTSLIGQVRNWLADINKDGFEFGVSWTKHQNSPNPRSTSAADAGKMVYMVATLTGTYDLPEEESESES